MKAVTEFRLLMLFTGLKPGAGHVKQRCITPGFNPVNKNIFLVIIFLLLTIPGQAQTFRFRANVNAVQQSGFHRILLPPDVVGHLNSNLTDIRLYDGQQHEVPYKLMRQQPKQTSLFNDYEIVSRKSVPNASTALVIRNRAKSRINSLELVVKNTNVSKKARLSGSNDAQNWFAIDDNIWLEPTPNQSGTTETKVLDFPLSDYDYYRLNVNDSVSTPLNILRVGYYKQVVLTGAYSPIPNVSFTQRDSSDKHTYIHLTRPDNARFDKLTLAVDASVPFHRRAELGQFRTRKLKRGRVDRWFETIRSFELSSADSNVVYLPGLKTSDLYVIIANDDNPPLRVHRVKAYQLTTYLVANLTGGSPYQLEFSADDASPPTYDLTSFKTDLLKNPSISSVGTISPTSSNNEPTASFFTDSRIIWPALGLVLVILGIMSYRMLREMGKANG